MYGKNRGGARAVPARRNVLALAAFASANWRVEMVGMLLLGALAYAETTHALHATEGLP